METIRTVDAKIHMVAVAEQQYGMGTRGVEISMKGMYKYVCTSTIHTLCTVHAPGEKIRLVRFFPSEGFFFVCLPVLLGRILSAHPSISFLFFFS